MIQSIIEFLRSLTNPERLIQLLSTLLSGWWGYAALSGIVFAETGLLLGFFLPGDSLLFTVGVVSGAGSLNIVAINAALMAAALVGDTTGFLLGRKTGPRIFTRPDSLLFKQEYVTRTRHFFDRYGGKTIILARFVPVIRTFAPFMAGVSGMRYTRFLSFSVFGAFGWVFSMTMLGYTLGSVPIIRRHFDQVVLLIIFISLLPTFHEAWKAWRGRSKQAVPAK
ncbi:MAG TPA: VTT domain-containing protein [Bryobacteraceae bacterium]|jgi:membrane-associated protein|nr:VTT domain-containing protein [Bryobacteraceae bacterium]